MLAKDSSDLISFLIAVMALFLIPGPAVFLTLAQSVHGGRRVGFATALGIALGDCIHVLMAIMGLSALLVASATAFQAVKYIGVMYLLYLAVKAWRAKPAEAHEEIRIEPGHAFRQALLTEILNPKTALFFLAFLPQFVHPERGPVFPQLVVLGAIFASLSLVYTTALAMAAAQIRPWLLGNSKLARIQGKLIGGIYLGLGVRLAFQERD
jgi:threonine/homoserine/homoserine lactone efflux protein